MSVTFLVFRASSLFIPTPGLHWRQRHTCRWSGFLDPDHGLEQHFTNSHVLGVLWGFDKSQFLMQWVCVVRGSPLLTGSPGMPSAVSSQAEKWPREIQPRPSSPGIGLLLCTSLLPCVTVHDPKSHVTQVSQTSNKLGHQWRFLKRFVLPGEAELVSGWENAVKKRKRKKKKQTNRDNEKFDNVPNETKHRALGLFPPIVFSGATLSLGWHTGHSVWCLFLSYGLWLNGGLQKVWKINFWLILSRRNTPQFFLLVYEYHTKDNSFLLNHFLGISWLWDGGRSSYLPLCAKEQCRSNTFHWSISYYTVRLQTSPTIEVFRLYVPCLKKKIFFFF